MHNVIRHIRDARGRLDEARHAIGRLRELSPYELAILEDIERMRARLEALIRENEEE